MKCDNTYLMAEDKIPLTIVTLCTFYFSFNAHS